MCRHEWATRTAIAGGALKVCIRNAAPYGRPGFASKGRSQVHSGVASSALSWSTVFLSRTDKRSRRITADTSITRHLARTNRGNKATYATDSINTKRCTCAQELPCISCDFGAPDLFRAVDVNQLRCGGQVNAMQRSSKIDVEVKQAGRMKKNRFRYSRPFFPIYCAATAL